jgi:hypothetical protein
MLEADMDPVFHAPYVRGLFLVTEREMGFWHQMRRLGASLRGLGERDRFQPVAERLDEIEVGGTELFRDVPEHFRRLVLRQIIPLPWSYWRYAMGAGTGARRFLYGELEPGEGGSAADPAHQIKMFAVKTAPIDERALPGTDAEGMKGTAEPGAAALPARGGKQCSER